MLAAGAAEAAQRVLGDVVAALHRDVLDRIRHVRDGDLEESVRDFLRRARRARSSRATSAASAANFARTTAASSGWSPAGPNTRGKSAGIELADHHVAVGDGQRPAAPVRRRAGIRAGRFGPDAKARAVERQIEPPPAATVWMRIIGAREPHAGDLGDERALVLAGVVRDVGRRAAHVEADDLVEAREPRNLDRADDAAGRTRQDRVLALEAMGVGQPAARLHELQPRQSVPRLRATARALRSPRARARPGARSVAGSATGTRRRPSCRRARRASSAGTPRATPRPARIRARARAARARARAAESDSRASARSRPRRCPHRAPRELAPRRRRGRAAARSRRARRCARRPRSRARRAASAARSCRTKSLGRF